MEVHESSKLLCTWDIVGKVNAALSTLPSLAQEFFQYMA